MRLAVTTALDPDADEREAAARAAADYGWRLAPRGRRGLARVAADCQADALLVLSARRAALWIEGTERAWSAGMGELRLRRLLHGERVTLDGLLTAAALQPGDAVLDATLGLGMDALVVAAAVGPAGSVVGLEASPVLAALTAEGLRRHPADAARRITVLAGDADAFLAQVPASSFDVVLFDPMFRTPGAQGHGFDLVRAFGDARPLTEERLRRARQVARRAVVVKDATPGLDLARLGLTPLPAAREARRVYARATALAAAAPLIT